MDFWDQYFFIESRDKRIDFSMETIDQMMRDGKFSEIDGIIKQATEDERLGIGDMVCLLSCTLWVVPAVDSILGAVATGLIDMSPKRHDYPSRPALVERCRQASIAKDGEATAKQLLQGLE